MKYLVVKACLSAVVLLISVSGFAKADSIGVASPYNVFVFGNLSSNSDINGRAAAGGYIQGNALTVGSNLVAGTAPANYNVVAESGLTAHINLNSGNAYAKGASVGGGNGQLNLNGGGTLTNNGGSGIDFAAAKIYYTNFSASLAGIAQNGQVKSVNPNQVQLIGVAGGFSVFDIAANTFSKLYNIDTKGGTVLVNVAGSTPSYQMNGLQIDGQQVTGNSMAGDCVIFNFYQASQVNINAQFGASVLAPLAQLTGNAQIDGTLIANSLNYSGEIHGASFAGSLPPASIAGVPEPGSMLLLACGMIGIGLAGRRARN